MILTSIPENQATEDQILVEEITLLNSLEDGNIFRTAEVSYEDALETKAFRQVSSKKETTNPDLVVVFNPYTEQHETMPGNTRVVMHDYQFKVFKHRRRKH